MDNTEKARILYAAVNEAAKNGFDFLEWYQNQLNVIPTGKMPEEYRIEHMCYLGIENVLLYSHDFLKALLDKGWQAFLRKIVIKKTPVYSLWDYLVRKGILDE